MLCCLHDDWCNFEAEEEEDGGKFALIVGFIEVGGGFGMFDVIAKCSMGLLILHGIFKSR